MTTPEAGVSLEVVIPLHNMQEHVVGCLRPILEQAGPSDVVTVVDDGSTDDTAILATELGARVIRIKESRGPYAGRHLVAEQSKADALLFVDGRSRALPGLLASHRRQLSEPDVSMSCTEVTVLPGSSFAGRVAASQAIFSLDKYIAVPGRLDYFPTCNLGVRRSAYLTVGGFRRMRSGGDADLCWRIQNTGLGRLDHDATSLMNWVPRHSVRGLARQWYRYGQSAATLSMMYSRPDSASSRQATTATRCALVARVTRQAREDFPATMMVIGLELLMRWGATRTRRHPLAAADFDLLGAAARLEDEANGAPSAGS